MYIGITVILCSMVYVLLVAYNYYSKERINSTETKVYSGMIIISILSLIFEFLSIVFVKNYESNYFISQFVNRSFIICILMWTSLLTHYIFTVSFIDNDSRNIKQKVFAKKFFIPFIMIVMVLMFMLAFLPLQFYSKGDTVFSYGLAPDLLNLIVMVYVIVWVAFAIANYKSLKTKKYLPVFVFIVFVIITLIVRNINPSLLLINATISLVTVLMYHTIENPDLKIMRLLNIAKMEAEQANIAKTKFLKNMSHEIATPINKAKGTNYMNMDTPYKEVNENAMIVDEYLDQLSEMAKNIIDVIKLENGTLELKEKVYNPKDLFNSMNKLIIPKIEKRGLKFNLKINGELPKALYGDADKIKQILMELLTNAIKYTSKGSINLLVIPSKKDNKCKLNISVKDTGVGIKKEKQKYLFNAFSRIDVDENITINGMGLGLTISKYLIELMKGSISVTSEFGKGSTFSFEIEQEEIKGNNK
ncbi:MAG: ATP-binding protein [Bacilli bacterium]|nr:ATP-binding protein [Bacilli bacterium]